MTAKPEAAIGDIVTGTCVTMGTTYTGRVTRVIGPIASPDCGGYRFRITDTGKNYAGGGPVEPIIFYAAHAATPDPAAQRRARVANHRAAMQAAGREPRG